MFKYDADSLAALNTFDMFSFSCEYVVFIHMIDSKSIKIEVIILSNQ